MELVAPRDTGIAAANLDLVEERKEGQTAGIPQLINVLEAISSSSFFFLVIERCTKKSLDMRMKKNWCNCGMYKEGV